MNREIKFRVWDEPNEMSFPKGCMTYFGVSNFIKGDYNVIMQYTGLKDKNGKEIYEGDIVELTDSDNKEIKEWNEVTFSHGMFSSTRRIKGNICVSDLISFHNRPDLYCEVIGNIYENPELLKGE